MESSYPLEIIPAAAISDSIKDATALILDTLGNNHTAEFLQRLHAHSTKKVYYTKPGINQLPGIVELTSRLGIKTIVLCPDKINSFKKILPKETFSACVISPGIITPQSQTTSAAKNVAKISPAATDPASVLASSKNVSDLSHIAYQTYRTSPSYLKKIRDTFHEELRLGSLRGSLHSAEPLMRNKEYFFIDLKAVRNSDFPGNPTNSPNGLYAEEMCQLARYAGMSQKFKTLFLYGMPSDLKANPAAGELAAETIWHITEAMAANLQEDPSDNSREEYFIKKIVSMGEDGQDITFVTSRSTGRWWVEIPVLEKSDNVHIPCSYTDYLTARSGDVPIRWLFFFQKLNPN
jgi:hypothetical protein